jgi:UDP-glucuronate decarboxylase
MLHTGIFLRTYPINRRIGHPHFELIRHDVVDRFMIEVDQIYHLACPASPPQYQSNPIKTVKTR